LFDRHIAHTDVKDLSLALELGERFDALPERNTRIGSMELIEPDFFDPQGAQALLACLADVLRRSVARPLATRPAQPGLGGDVDGVAIAALANRRGDEPLIVSKVAVVEAVDIGRVDECDSCVDCRVDHTAALIVRRTTLDRQRHAAEADRGNGDIGASQSRGDHRITFVTDSVAAGEALRINVGTPRASISRARFPIERWHVSGQPAVRIVSFVFNRSTLSAISGKVCSYSSRSVSSGKTIFESVSPSLQIAQNLDQLRIIRRFGDDMHVDVADDPLLVDD